MKVCRNFVTSFRRWKQWIFLESCAKFAKISWISETDQTIHYSINYVFRLLREHAGAPRTSASPGSARARPGPGRRRKRRLARDRRLPWRRDRHLLLHVNYMFSYVYYMTIHVRKVDFTCKTCQICQTILRISIFVPLRHFLKIFAKFRRNVIKIKHGNGKLNWKWFFAS